MTELEKYLEQFAERYPIIRPPDSLSEILKKSPILPKKPEPPKPPTKPYEVEGKLGMIDLILVGSLILGISMMQDRDTKGWGMFFMFIGIPSCLRVLLTIFDTKPGEATEAYKEKYAELLKDFEKKRIEHERELVEYNAKVELLNSPDSVREYRKSVFTAEFKIKSLPESVLVVTARKGISENFFRDALSKVYGDKILTDQRVLLKGYYFYPDIVYFDKEKNLAIDIEIDEPYVGSTGEPIHYEYADISRDKLFSEYNWTVIRFAEEQIIKFPSDCIATIGKVIDDFTRRSITNTDDLSMKRIKVWTKDESHKMAFSRYRHSYLPQSMQERLKSESFQQLSDSKSGVTPRLIDGSDDLPF